MIVGTACGRTDSRNTPVESIASADSASAASVLTVDAYGIGAVRVGMSLRQLSETLGETIKPEYEINDECDFVHPKAMPKGVAFMILQDSVARVDVDSAGILTREGVGVGDLESRVLTVYGSRARVEPHHYTGPQGHYVYVATPGDTLHRIVFETDGQRVDSYRAGRLPGVDYIEGCA